MRQLKATSMILLVSLASVLVVCDASLAESSGSTLPRADPTSNKKKKKPPSQPKGGPGRRSPAVTPNGKGKSVDLPVSLPGKESAGQPSDNTPYNTTDGQPTTKFSQRLRQSQGPLTTFCEDLYTQLQQAQSAAGVVRTVYMTECLQQGDPTSTTTLPAPNPPPNPYLLGAEAVTRLTIPAPAPLIGPDPSINKWNMAVVNLNYWLHVNGPTTLASSVTLQGHTISLTATRRNVQFSMGDGTVKTCAATTPWVKGTPPTVKSPTCGHLYTKKSKPYYYRLRALATWDVTWSVMGQSGTIPVTTSDSRQLLVGELVSVIVPNR